MPARIDAWIPESHGNKGFKRLVSEIHLHNPKRDKKAHDSYRDKKIAIQEERIRRSLMPPASRRHSSSRKGSHTQLPQASQETISFSENQSYETAYFTISFSRGRRHGLPFSSISTKRTAPLFFFLSLPIASMKRDISLALIL